MSKVLPEGRPTQSLPKETTTVMFPCSVRFKEALDSYCGALNKTRSEVIRDIIGKHIEYDFEGEQKAARKGRKYASVEERKLAMTERARQKRVLTRQLLDAYQQQETEEVIQALVLSLQEL